MASTAGPADSPETDHGQLPQAFLRAHGRPLRVLLIGNIANYAYVTAKMLRRAGVECVVADPDFYHIMATPEWIETRFEGHWDDDFLPKWSKTTLAGYERPRWFVQAPAGLVFEYLAAYSRGGPESAARLIPKLDQARWIATGDLSAMELQQRAARSGAKRLLNALRARAKKMPGASRLLALAGLNRKRNALASGAGPAPTPGWPDPPPALADYLLRTGFLDQRPAYQAALAGFDIIQGFTLSAVFAALVGHPRFCALELGTLRGLPFEDSDAGRMTAWLYLQAPQVMITNVDCVEAANRLGIPEDRQKAVLHAYDVESARAYAASFTHPAPAGDKPPYFFAPARHHWKSGNLSWLKGNDVIIRAAGRLARQGRPFRLIFVEWGEELALSRDLIASEGIADRVSWIKPQPRLNLWPLYMGAAAVVDQFQAAAFGGVGLDAMALGRRLISRYDEKAGSRFFSSPPPMLNCETDEQVAAAMDLCLSDPQDKAARGIALQDWLSREHGMDRQLQDLFEVYARLLKAAPVGPA